MIFDGPNTKSKEIGKVFGKRHPDLLKSISSTGSSLLIALETFKSIKSNQQWWSSAWNGFEKIRMSFSKYFSNFLGISICTIKDYKVSLKWIKACIFLWQRSSEQCTFIFEKNMIGSSQNTFQICLKHFQKLHRNILLFRL